MGQPSGGDTRSSEQARGSDEINRNYPTRQDTMSEKQDFEKDPETAQRARNGQSTHIDEAVAARIAENVDDFMVTEPLPRLN